MIVTNAWSSIVKYLKDKYPEFTYCDFEMHADIQELPDANLIGVSGIGFAAEEQTDNIAFSMALCTRDDPNGFNIRKAAAELYEDWRNPAFQIPLYDADETTVIGGIVALRGAVLAPISRAETRPFQILTAHAKLV